MTRWLITGANRGIGLALADALVARGDAVVATTRTEAAALIDLRRRAPDRLSIVTMDVADERSVRLAAVAVDGPIDRLVNNAGVSGQRAARTIDLDPELVLATFAVNTVGPLRVVRAFLPHLRRTVGAKVLNISTQMGSLTYAGARQSDRMAYRASKAALNKITQGLATDLASEGIAVVAVHPGWVRTDMGGQAADLSVEQSVAGIVALADRIGLAETGQFFRHDGSIHPW